MVLTSLAGLSKHLPCPPPCCRDTEQPGHLEESPTDGTQTLNGIHGLAKTEPADPLSTETTVNKFGVFCCYSLPPLHDPEEDLFLDNFVNPTSLIHNPQPELHNNPLCPFGSSILSHAKEKVLGALSPFTNITVFRLMHWLHSGSVLKSASELTCLVCDVFLPANYSHDHILDFNADQENTYLNEYTTTSSAFSADNGWCQGYVLIPLPKEWCTHSCEADAPQLQVTNIFYCLLVEVIKAAYQDPTAYCFHWFPFQFLWQCHPTSPPEQVYTNIYNSDTMLQEHKKICTKAKNDQEQGDNDGLEYAIVPISLYLDSTHLTSFGTASLWPIYTFFASIFKYF